MPLKYSMRHVTALFLVSLLALPAFAEDLVLVNGTILDGTGKARALGSVRIVDGKFTDVGVFKPMPGEMILDVKGMIVAPGFVDLQSLSPSAIEKDPAATSLIAEGVTTAVLGSDGAGPYSVEDFMLPFDEKPPALNIALLVGHATVRRQIMGSDYKRAATADEISRMGELVADAMKQGAFGLASDLQQEPASFATPEELKALSAVIAKFGGTFVISARDEKEAIALARNAKIAVQVLNANKAAIAEIDKARAQGVDIASEFYSFPQLLRDKTITLERAIQRMTGTPAGRLGLRERGVLKKGMPADVVVFNPQALAAGMKYVFANGTMIVKDGQPTGARPGQALR
jgi:N-acyl-D-amino-acid deacylase